MSFIFNEVDKFELDGIKRQFSSFFKEEDKLPFCRINFYERPRNIKLNEGKTLLKRLGGVSFYSFEGGVMVANATTYAVVHSDYTEMDVYLPPEGKFVTAQLAFLMLQAYRYILIHKGMFQIHSATVMYNGVGIAFCGLPGAGKSTQAHLWEEHLGAEALNLDQPCILFEGENTLVSGSPWSGKENCYRNDTAPLAAIFFVEQAKENSVERMSAAEAFSYVFLNNYLVPQNDEFEEKHKAAVMKLVTAVPVYRLKCTISREAVDVAYKAVFGEK